MIASDKTGTLTEGVMSVERAWTPTCELAITGAGYAPEGTVRVSPSTAGEVPPQDVLTLLAAGRCATTPGSGHPRRAQTGRRTAIPPRQPCWPRRPGPV